MFPLSSTGPLNNRIFVANLDYKVGEKKLEEIFRLAGKVLRVRLYTDQGGTSKGHGKQFTESLLLFCLIWFSLIWQSIRLSNRLSDRFLISNLRTFA